MLGLNNRKKFLNAAIYRQLGKTETMQRQARWELDYLIRHRFPQPVGAYYDGLVLNSFTPSRYTGPAFDEISEFDISGFRPSSVYTTTDADNEVIARFEHVMMVNTPETKKPIIRLIKTAPKRYLVIPI